MTTIESDMKEEIRFAKRMQWVGGALFVVGLACLCASVIAFGVPQ